MISKNPSFSYGTVNFDDKLVSLGIYECEITLDAYFAEVIQTIYFRLRCLYNLAKLFTIKTKTSCPGRQIIYFRVLVCELDIRNVLMIIQVRVIFFKYKKCYS